MVKTSKWDLTTVVASLATTVSGTDLGIGAVAQDKKRFVTYIKIQCRGIANTITIGEAAAAGATALSATQFSQYVNTEYEYPEEPGDVDHPLFAIGASAYMCAVTSDDDGGATILTFQYYDA